MITVNITEAKARLSEFVRIAAGGEEVVITQMGRPSARLTPMPVEEKTPFLGFLKGTITLPEDWDEWPEEEARALGIID